tara:strand:+ start:520 stop:1137 length:618 start_codon:yes stop_codon:yes gene_type:complete
MNIGPPVETYEASYYQQIGSFTNESGHMIIMDPRFDRSFIEKVGALCNVESGTWHASIYRNELIDRNEADNTEHNWGFRVWELAVRHEAAVDEQIRFAMIGDIGVDSAMVAICDSTKWGSDSITEGVPENINVDEMMVTYLSIGDQRRAATWTGAMWRLTCIKERNAGVFNGGAVSSSGVGDGCYALCGYEQDGRFSAFKVIFLP